MFLVVKIGMVAHWEQGKMSHKYLVLTTVVFNNCEK